MSGQSPSAPVFASVGRYLTRTLIADLVLVTAWVVAVSVGSQIVGLPAWLYYVVVFGGVVAYSLAGGLQRSGAET